MYIRSVFDTVDTAGTIPVSNTVAVGSGNGSALQPKGAFYEITSTTTLNSIGTHRRYGIGMADGTLQAAVGVMSEGGQITTVADGGTRADVDSVVNFPLGTSELIDGEMSWNSWVNGGSKLFTNNLFASAFQLRATYIFGDDVVCAVKHFNIGQATSGSVSGLSFAPNMAMAISYGDGGIPFSNDVAIQDMTYSHGYAVKTPTGGIQQACVGDFMNDRSSGSTQCGTIVRDDSFIQCVHDVGGIPTLAGRVILTSWNSDGASFTNAGTSDATVAILFVGFTNKRKLYAGVTSIPGATGAGDFAVTDPGFTPEAYFAIASVCDAKNAFKTTAATGAGKLSSGSYTGSESGYSSGSCDDAVTTSASRSAAGDNAVFHVIDTGGGDAFSGTHVSLDTNGFTLNLTGSILGDGSPQIVFCVIGPPQIIESDTETIAESFNFAGTYPAVSDTEEIADTVVFSGSGNTIVEDTEEISDETAMAIDMALADTEEISENVILISLAADALLLVLMDTEEISDQTVFSGEGSLVVSDQVDILDLGNLAGSALMVVSDSETITEDEQHYLGNLIVVSDTETISDEMSTPITATQTKGTARGSTFAGGAEEGQAFQGGAERGTVL